MPLIKNLDKVKDEEITLLDVKRAEEIIERANKLLGREKEVHHYHGWRYWWNDYTTPRITYTSTTDSPLTIDCNYDNRLMASAENALSQTSIKEAFTT